ncbi:MAG: hypothetical protein IPG63_11045 [Xanthomonadales bacterium]|nr:hypothetical protein [Xanthomonadales bacterium]
MRARSEFAITKAQLPRVPAQGGKRLRSSGYHHHAMWNNMLRFLRKLDVAATRRELGLPEIDTTD